MAAEAVTAIPVTAPFDLTQFAPLGRIVDGGFVPVWWAAAPVYVCLGLGIASGAFASASVAAAAFSVGAR